MTFEELEQRGNELAALRDGCKDESKIAMLNKEITSIRHAQIKVLADEIVAAFKLVIPELVEHGIKASGVREDIAKLQRGE